PKALRVLLEDCLEEVPQGRPANFAVVLERLRRLNAAPLPVIPLGADDEEVPTLKVADAEEPAEVLPVDAHEDEEVVTLRLAEPEERVPVATPAPRPRPTPKAVPVAKPAIPGTSIRIVYKPDGAILDSAVEVFLDGKVIGKGRVLGGFDVSVPTTVGIHQ